MVYEYDAWGNILSVKNANGVNIANPNSIANIQSLRYRGYYYDSDTGFYYLQSRYYDPVTHRFINSDCLLSSISGILGYNLFVYCNNNPINYYDYTGLLCGSGMRLAPGGILIEGDFEKYARYMLDQTKKRIETSLHSSKAPSTSSSSTFSLPISGTHSIGGTVSAGCGAGFSLSNGIGINQSGDVMRITTISVGGSTPSAYVGGYYSLSEASTVNELRGWSFIIGGSAGEAASVGCDVGSGFNGKKQFALNAGATIKAPIPFEGHALFSYTIVNPLFNVNSFTYSDIMKLWW